MVSDDNEPVTPITVLVEVSVIVMVKLFSLSVVAVARKLFGLMHMLLGWGTLPVYAIDAPL